jgi:hypothetical protein
VKLPSPRFPKVLENEFAMMTLARDLGIDVPEIWADPDWLDRKSSAWILRKTKRTRTSSGVSTAGRSKSGFHTEVFKRASSILGTSTKTTKRGDQTVKSKSRLFGHRGVLATTSKTVQEGCQIELDR